MSHIAEGGSPGKKTPSMCDCEQWSYFEDQLYRDLSIIIEITKHDVRMVFSLIIDKLGL